MSVSRDWVGQVKGVVAELQKVRESGPNVESEAWQAFEWNSHLLAPPQLEQTPRARQIRAINRIVAHQPDWKMAVTHFLDTKGVCYLSDLTDPQVDDLHGRMLGYVEAATYGYDIEGPFAGG